MKVPVKVALLSYSSIQLQLSLALRYEQTFLPNQLGVRYRLNTESSTQKSKQNTTRFFDIHFSSVNLTCYKLQLFLHKSPIRRGTSAKSAAIPLYTDCLSLRFLDDYSGN